MNGTHVDGCQYPGCDRTLVPDSQWKASDQQQRLIWNAAGVYPHKGRGLCPTCYDRARRTDTLLDFERTTVPLDMVLEEWERMDHEGRSRQDVCRQLAPRLGMTWWALEKALDRASVRGQLVEPSTYRVLREREATGCGTCGRLRANVYAVEGQVATAARRLAADPDSVRARRLLESVRAELDKAKAAVDFHVDAEHQGMEVAA